MRLHAVMMHFYSWLTTAETREEHVTRDTFAQRLTELKWRHVLNVLTKVSSGTDVKQVQKSSFCVNASLNF